MTKDEFAAVVHQLAEDDAPRLFAIVEEYGEAEDARVAGYGLAYDDRAEVDSVEGGFRLSSQSAESARALFEVGSRSTGTRRAHLVWLGEPQASAGPERAQQTDGQWPNSTSSAPRRAVTSWGSSP
ncbi:hypothetical protein F4560_007742 [Saccharothrix ecbatanensis]|uniref:Uncharacterized protein n=1 Tax=Saccharothrix ecbatanensis TaxID=1105145 RepID=A0A7W9M5H8_9PSEU|nr:hypothetical protein [Saccharothrix ecbatanensis]MBB5807974.1 hypothetical protein [Saccharothrix ecbatanensis]